MTDISVPFALLAGLVSFLSPCVLPIIPGFLAYLAGTSVNDSSGVSRWKTFRTSIFFVLGFSFVFAALGVLLNTILSNVAYGVQAWLARIGGAIIIFFGLYLVGLIKIGFLEVNHQIAVTHRFASRDLTAFVFGAAFAAGWTPCVGAVLGGILALAASQPGSAFFLLLTYAVGLGAPFLLVGLFAGNAQKLFERYAHIAHIVNIIFGVMLIILGVLVFTERLSLIANFGFINDLLLQ